MRRQCRTHPAAFQIVLLHFMMRIHGTKGAPLHSQPLMQDSVHPELHEATAPVPWMRRWWRRQTPGRQDRFAMLAPLAAVLLFLAAIISAFWYLRLEEIDREQEAVRRDVEYGQQRLRLRLL